MTETLHFLPWLRRGLGLTLTNRDPASGPLPRSAPIPASITIDTETVDAPLSLRPADHATTIDTSQIVRRFPTPNTTDAEWGYFPLADVIAPDLPWVLSPAAPDEAAGDPASTGSLRPWLVLVCVEEATATFVPGSPGRPARLAVPAEQLPDLDESYAWAHVQSAVDPSDVIEELSTNPASVIARFICPRRLSAQTAYRCALVAAFSADGDSLVSAWSAATSTADLLVYDTWTFRTGDANSFKELCERLGPVTDPTFSLGLHRTDLTDLGATDPWPAGTTEVIVDYQGALLDIGVAPDTLGTLIDDFAGPLRAMLNRTELHPTIQPDDPDPIVGPPFYGSYAAEADSVPLLGWMAILNLAPAPRMAAGRGAEVVRLNQERFMQIAWAQAGELRETNRQLSFTRLQGEIATTWKERTDRLDPHERVALTRSQLSFVRDANGHPPRRLLRESSFPSALVSPAYLRVTRPGSGVAKAGARRNPEQPSWLGSLSSTFGSARSRSQLTFGTTITPQGTRLPDSRHHGIEATNLNVDRDDVGDFDLDATAELATTAIAPTAAAVARLTARIPALVKLLAAIEPADTPTRVATAPEIDEALMWPLVDMSPELLLPGVDEFPDNAIRIVEAHPAFVAAFMAGANHEMIRELLWREYPAELTATTFRRFWDRRDRSVMDIEPIADWPRFGLLESLGAAGGESVVLLIRGDLIHHYPNVRVLLIDPDTNVGKLPVFGGWIPPDVRFMGYDADPDVVTEPGSEWRIAIEEQPTEPRFGLDTPAPGDSVPRLVTWDDLCWEQLTGHDDATHLMIGDEFPSNEMPPPDADWGLNSAHMARATYQRRFREEFRVVDLIGGRI